MAQSVAQAPSACIASPVGLENWWPGDGNARDIQAGRNGSIVGNVLSSSGKVGPAFNFDGTNAMVEASVDFVGADNWSMSAWVFWRGPSKAVGQKSEALIYHGIGGSNGYGLFIIGPGWCKDYPQLCPHEGELTILFGGVRWYFTDVSIVPNTWTHVALVRASGLLKLYLNGALAWNRLSVEPIPPTTKLDISLSQPYTFNGLIDEASLFSAPLDTGHFSAMVEAGAAGMCKGPEFANVVRAGLGRVEFQVKGSPKKDVLVLISPDLSTWEPILQLPNLTGTLNFSAPINHDLQQRYYRLAPAN